MNRLLVALLGVLLVSGLVACGGGDDARTTADEGDARTIEVDMVDTAFEPDQIEIEAGETVRFVFTNRGTIVHEALIGDHHTQTDHAAEMEADGGGHGDGEPSDDVIVVDPGETGDTTHTFDEAGTYEIGCHQPGHYDDGMKADVEVV